MKYHYICLMLLMVLLSACAAEGLAADQLPWVGDPPILFKDDFSHPNGGWTTHEDSLSFIGYHEGGFRLKAAVPKFQFWSVPRLNFKDVQVYVQAEKLDGPNNNLFGVLCRYQDPENFYAFLLGSDGYYGIFEMNNGDLTLVDQIHMDFNQDIHRGKATNAIMAVCEGEQLGLFVNDIRLLQVQDDSLSYGDVGLIAGNLSEGGVDILFDNFIVIKR